MPALARSFGELEAYRGKYATNDSVHARVVELVVDYAAKLPLAAAPVLADIEPRDDDPALTHMLVTSDRERLKQRWSIIGAKADQPEFTGSLAHDETRRVLTIPMRLEPLKSCRFSLDNARAPSLRSMEGTPPSDPSKPRLRHARREVRVLVSMEDAPFASQFRGRAGPAWAGLDSRRRVGHMERHDRQPEFEQLC